MDPEAIAMAKAKAQAIAAAALNPQKRKLEDAQEPPAKIAAVESGAGMSEMAKMGLAAAAAAGITPQSNALPQQSPARVADPYAPAPQRETIVKCPPSLVGRVIGRGGETINNLQMQSGCHIQIDQTSMGPTEDRNITINGMNPAQVQKAIELVRSVMSSGPGGGPAPIQQPGGGHSGYAFNEIIDCPANLVGRVIGRGGETIKSLQMQNACHIDIDQSMPAGLPRKITVSANTREAVSRGVTAIQTVMNSGSTAVLKTITGPCSISLDCDASLVGRLIGRKGETINDMQSRSGCRIQIDQDVPAGMPRKVIISAQTDDQVRIGVEIVKAVMTNGPRPQIGSAPGGAGFGGQPPAHMQQHQQQQQYAQYYQMQQMQYAQYYQQMQQQQQQQFGGYPGYGASGYPGYGYPPAGYAPRQQQPQPQQQQQPAPAGDAPSTGSSQWAKYFNDQGRPYWHNATTGVTQWEDPEATPVTPVPAPAIPAVADTPAEASSDAAAPAADAATPAEATVVSPDA